MSVKMWAPDHKDWCHIALLNGRTFLIPNHEDGIEVPKEFRRVAIARGCVRVGAEPEEIESDCFYRATTIRGAEKHARSEAPAWDGPREQPVTRNATAVDLGVPAQPDSKDEPTMRDHHVDANLGDLVFERIARALRRVGDTGLTRTALRDLFGRNVPAHRIQAALALLRINGMAKRESARTGGRPSEVWRRAK